MKTARSLAGDIHQWSEGSRFPTSFKGQTCQHWLTRIAIKKETALGREKFARFPDSVRELVEGKFNEINFFDLNLFIRI